MCNLNKSASPICQKSVSEGAIVFSLGTNTDMGPIGSDDRHVCSSLTKKISLLNEAITERN